MDIAHLKDFFIETYGLQGGELRIFFAPGRVNLIGEHTDYNGGYVLPFAVNSGTWLLIRQNDDEMIRLTSLNFKYSLSVPVDESGIKRGNEWVNYPLGVLNEFRLKGMKFPGLDIMYIGTIPNGAGLSSSASIEMVTAFAINSMFGFGIDITGLALISQHAENCFVGMNCGIMDQFVVGLAKKNNALLINCSVPETFMVPFVLKEYHVIIVNTNKKRELTRSKYNERVSECRQAVAALSKARPVKYLSELDYDEFNEIKHLIKDDNIRNRALHVISENKRVLDSVKFLKKNDLKNFGLAMIASHASLKNLYEVTGFELDTLAEEALKIPGVIGSRMTGAGFGGCTINLVEKQEAENFVPLLDKNYNKKTGLTADFYFAGPSDGVREIL